MCKKAIGFLVVLLSGVWAQAQQALPGYAVVGPAQGSARPGAAVAASPPEPVGIGAMFQQPPAGYPTGPALSGPGAMMAPGAMGPGGMVGPGGMPQGGMPQGGMMGPMGPGSPYPPAGPGGPGFTGSPYPNPMGGYPAGGYPGNGTPGMDSGLPIGPISTFGTETFWVSLDYAAGWLQKPRLTTPLITEGSPADAHPGALGQPGTVIAFGDDNYKFGTYHGFDIALGVNLTDHWSLEADALVLPSQHVMWTVGSDAGGNPLIARPVNNVQNGGTGSFLTSLPGVASGYTQVEARSELWGIGVAAHYRYELTPYLTADAFIGYRSMELLENLTISDGIVPLTPSFTFQGNTINPAPGVSIQDYDRFATNNTFNGVDFGARFRWQSGWDWLAGSGFIREALGGTTQTVNISGATTLATPAGNSTVSGGVLALPSNGGNFSRNVFGSITEGGVGIIITPWKYVRFDVGYSAMYWNSVVRPGNQINPNVSFSQVPSSQNFSGPAAGNQPTFAYHSQGLVVQTLNFGMSFYY